MEISTTTITTASPFSVDLIENSLKHKWFLRTIHELGISLNHISLLSLHRYVDCWLTLVDKHPSTPLIPPADVAWLWHCHRLAPKDYEEYVVGRFGLILEATFPFSLQYAHAENYSQESLTTQDLWALHFPDELFFVEDTKDIVKHPEQTSYLLGDFDLLGSTRRQATFLWQVSSPSFDDISFLEQGLKNYIRFLMLKPKAKLQGSIIVPT
jgi:hypothetical protein